MVASVPSVELIGLCKRYPGVQALGDVGFTIQPGEVHALVGENGAGKSTLVKLLAGAAAPDAGEIHVNGRAVRFRGVGDSRRSGIAVVFQEFNLAGDLSVAENVFLGRWPRGRFGLIDYAALHARATALFESLGVTLDIRGRVGDLSVAQRQMVEIARALSLDATVLVLDEPSAVLTPMEVAALFGVVHRLTAREVGVLYISHRLDEVFELCDRVTVLRDGRRISTRSIREANREQLIGDMVGRSIDDEFPARTSSPGDVVLRVEGLSAKNRFQDVTFDLRRGEVLALTGLVGSGRSSVGQALFGTVAGARGRVFLGEDEAMCRSPRRAKRLGIALVPEDRRRQGLLLERSLRENMSLADLGGVSTLGVLGAGRERSSTDHWIRSLRIKSAGGEATAGTLSGGNQQKVLIARWLRTACRVMILDEPTRGVDIGAKIEIYSIINDLARRGTAVLLITSELGEAIGMADRIAVMAGGRLTGILNNLRRDVSQAAILRLCVPQGNERSAKHAEEMNP